MSSKAVVLLHGMGRSWVSMALLGHRLKRAGYEIHLFRYSPRRATLDELSRGLQTLIEEKVEARSYHLIGHSLGNIIVRHGFRQNYRSGLERIVMLAPPNGPAALASSLRHNRLYPMVDGGQRSKARRQSLLPNAPDPERRLRRARGRPRPSSRFR